MVMDGRLLLWRETVSRRCTLDFEFHRYLSLYQQVICNTNRFLITSSVEFGTSTAISPTAKRITVTSEASVASFYDVIMVGFVREHANRQH